MWIAAKSSLPFAEIYSRVDVKPLEVLCMSGGCKQLRIRPERQIVHNMWSVHLHVERQYRPFVPYATPLTTVDVDVHWCIWVRKV
jgi:hypothetical protein